MICWHLCLWARATLIEGGLLLTVCLYHQLADEHYMNAVMAALGEQCRLAETSESLSPREINTDRKVLLRPDGLETDLKDNLGYSRKEDAT